MQASRQCAVCASRATGALLHSRNDVLLLRTNMAALRRGAACLSFLRSSASVLINNRKPTVQRLEKFTDVVHTSVASLSVGFSLCAVPFTQKAENLSHDSLIKRAASLVTDSSSTFLSQTSLALIDALTEYSKAVHALIALQRRYLASLGKLTPAEEDSIWQVIIGQRTEVSDRLDECKRFESTWVNAVNLCELAAEAAYTSGAEQASITMRTNIQVAQSQVEEARKLLVDADKKLAETKVEEIQRMAEYAAFLENDGEEHEVHEAYLRED
ncbi:diablo, IAP-binding mitochondrial protein a [Myripristis murdjan]|uniref:Direct IAP-binding protein with low pI n=1 Tax=Myripristis murdjan TaxID=586833 RepID=A0A667WNS3_9TELE|nr:diablo homolog, mitochondrial [Myripristis murdjan]